MTKCVILGTGPSLKEQKNRILDLKEAGDVVLFGVNNTFNDFPLDFWIACDPKWHEHYGQVRGSFEKWHWDEHICKRYGYNYIEGRWGEGLSLDPNYIRYGHCSGYQALNIALHKGFKEIYLAGHDFEDLTQNRHYFSGLSDVAGEYPKAIRKYSSFKGLLKTYSYIEKQDLPCKIYNINRNSALKTFEFKDL